MKAFITRRRQDPVPTNCSCRIKEDCPQQGKCVTKDLIYEAEVTPLGQTQNIKSYIGMTAGLFKTRFNNHRTSFRYTEKRSTTKLASHIWDLKDKGLDYAIRWTVIDRAKPYRNGSKICRLCSAEKLAILAGLRGPNKNRYLNSRTEIFGKCPHADRFLLHAWDASRPPN